MAERSWAFVVFGVYKLLKNPQDAELYYLLGGAVASVIASLAKTVKNTKTFTRLGICKMFAEALSCAILTVGLSLSIHEYYGASLSYAVGIGAFVGSLGNTVIIETVSSLIATYFKVGRNATK